MWEVVKRTKDKEKVMFDSVSYGDSYSQYETLAAQFNVVDEDGKYLYPEIRISLRKV